MGVKKLIEVGKLAYYPFANPGSGTLLMLELGKCGSVGAEDSPIIIRIYELQNEVVE